MGFMTVKELMEQAKERCERPRPVRLCDMAELDTLDCDNIDNLLISHNYSGPIPNLHMFPKLKKLHIIKQISLTDFEQMDLSSIEDLYVVFEKKEHFIRFNLPNIKNLNVYISNNENVQLSLFDTFDAIIDISVCTALEELSLLHCTGYEIKTDVLPKLKRLVCIDHKKYDFEILKFTPNLTHLVAMNCWVENIDFLKLTPHLLFLNLSYNEITDASKISELSNLKSLDIYRNPLDDLEKYKTLPFKVLVTEKDNDFQMFLHSIWTSINSAYSMLKSARKPDPKRKPFIQQMYDQQTDEQIFTRNLASNIKQDIEYHTSTEKNWKKNILLTVEELTDFVLQEYPFLTDFFETKV